MKSFALATWPEIEALRERVTGLRSAPHLVGAAEGFAEVMAIGFESVILARVFAVLPFSSLPPTEAALAIRATPSPTLLKDSTPVLSLLGTRGRLPAWNDREASSGHRAIPLMDQASVSAAPMIAKLLSDLRVDLRALDDGRPIATRQMLGGTNGTFYVPDAANSVDQLGRYIIPARDFVAENSVRTVFGMGGAYMDGTLLLSIIFANELLGRPIVDRFASLISSFKTATTRTVAAHCFYPPAPDTLSA